MAAGDVYVRLRLIPGVPCVLLTTVFLLASLSPCADDTLTSRRSISVRDRVDARSFARWTFVRTSAGRQWRAPPTASSPSAALGFAGGYDTAARTPSGVLHHVAEWGGTGGTSASLVRVGRWALSRVKTAPPIDPHGRPFGVFRGSPSPLPRGYLRAWASTGMEPRACLRHEGEPGGSGSRDLVQQEVGSKNLRVV